MEIALADGQKLMIAVLILVFVDDTRGVSIGERMGVK